MRAVFRAAVRSIGSSSTNWTKYIANEIRIAELLGEFDPIETRRRFDSGRLTDEDLGAAIPGQYRQAQARAIRKWAVLLDDRPEFYESVLDVARAFVELADGDLSGSSLMICVVAYFGAERPPARWRGEHLLSEATRSIPPAGRKFPGMLHPLAAEFLRNLGWDGFKIDRHIARLLERWLGEERLADYNAAARPLLKLIGKEDATTMRYVRYSLAGIDLTPDDVSLNESDNIVWLLGANVETKHRSALRESYLSEAR